MNLRNRHGVAAVAAVLVLGLSYAADGHAAWVLFDSFASANVDPKKWTWRESTGGSEQPTTETQSQVRFGKALLSMTQWGRVDSDSGAASGTNRLGIVDPSAILGMKAQILVIRAEAEGCANNPFVVQARARMLASLFNDGSSTGPGDLTGDIVANIETVLDGSQGKVILAVRFRCANPSCSLGDQVVIVNFTTTWQLYRPHTVSFSWDPPNKKLIYTAKPLSGPEEVIEIPYSYDDSRPPGGKFAQFQARLNPPNCNGARKRATMEYLADQVMTLLP